MTSTAWLLLAGLAGVVGAAEESSIPLEGPKREETVADKLARRENTQIAEISAKYDVMEKDVQAMRVRGMGWGEIERVLEVSSRVDRPLSEITELRESGMSWDEIADHYRTKRSQTKVHGEQEQMRDAVGQPRKTSASKPSRRSEDAVPALGEQGQQPKPVIPRRNPRDACVESPGEQGLLGK